jgi:hypothetical protein
MRSAVSILVIAGAAGAWLAFALLALRYLGAPFPT